MFIICIFLQQNLLTPRENFLFVRRFLFSFAYWHQLQDSGRRISNKSNSLLDTAKKRKVLYLFGESKIVVCLSSLIPDARSLSRSGACVDCDVTAHILRNCWPTWLAHDGVVVDEERDTRVRWVDCDYEWRDSASWFFCSRRSFALHALYCVYTRQSLPLPIDYGYDCLV